MNNNTATHPQLTPSSYTAPECPGPLEDSAQRLKAMTMATRLSDMKSLGLYRNLQAQAGEVGIQIFQGLGQNTASVTTLAINSLMEAEETLWDQGRRFLNTSGYPVSSSLPPISMQAVIAVMELRLQLPLEPQEHWYEMYHRCIPENRIEDHGPSLRLADLETKFNATHWTGFIAMLSRPEWISQHIEWLQDNTPEALKDIVTLLMCDRVIGTNATQSRRLMEQNINRFAGTTDGMKILGETRRARQALYGTKPWTHQWQLNYEQMLHNQIKQGALNVELVWDKFISDTGDRIQAVREMLIALKQMMPETSGIIAGSAAAWALGITNHKPADADFFCWIDQRRIIQDWQDNNKLNEHARGLRRLAYQDWRQPSAWKLEGVEKHDQDDAATKLAHEFARGLHACSAPKQDPTHRTQREIALQAGIPLAWKLEIARSSGRPISHELQERALRGATLMSRAADRVDTNHSLIRDHLKEEDHHEFSAPHMIAAYRGGFQIPGDITVLSTGNVQIVHSYQVNVHNDPLGHRYMSEEEVADRLLHGFDIPMHRAAIWLEGDELRSMEFSALGWNHPSLNWDGDAERIMKCVKRGYDVPEILVKNAEAMIERAEKRQTEQPDQSGYNWQPGILFERLVCKNGQIQLSQQIKLSHKEAELLARNRNGSLQTYDHVFTVLIEPQKIKDEPLTAEVNETVNSSDSGNLEDLPF